MLKIDMTRVVTVIAYSRYCYRCVNIVCRSWLNAQSVLQRSEGNLS